MPSVTTNSVTKKGRAELKSDVAELKSDVRRILSKLNA